MYKYATIDIESTGLNRFKDEITWIGVGFSKSLEDECAIKTFDFSTKEGLKGFKDTVSRIKTDRMKTVFQNGKFDTLFIEHRTGIKLPINEDIMLMGTAYDLAAEHGLKKMAQRYLGVEDWDISKKEKLNGKSPTLRPYLRKDVKYTWMLFQFFMQAMSSEQLKIYKKLLLPAYRMYRDVERNGAYVDLKALRECRKKYMGIEKECLYALNEQYKINWNSSRQVSEVLFDKEGLPVIKKSQKTGKPSADAAVLKRLAAQGHKLPQQILDYKAANTLNKMFLNRWEDDLGPDKRIHPSFNLTNVVSGRTSCLVGDTPVMVPGGYKPIKDIKKGDLVYSFDKELNPVLSKVAWSGCTGYRSDIVRIWYKTQGKREIKYIDVTSDHEIRLIDGSYKQAKNLIAKNSRKPGDHVLAIERGFKGNGKGYRLYVSGNDSVLEHVFVYYQVNGYTTEHIHHIDGNPLNNDPKNLEGMTAKEHASHHIKSYGKEWHSKGGKAAVLLRDNEYYSQHRKILMEQRCSKQELIKALEDGNGVIGACKILKRDYSFVRNRMQYYGISYDGRKSSMKNNHVILKVEPLSVELPVYDISVPDTNCFIANGICVHNCQNPNLQQVPRTKDVRAIYKAPPGRCFFEADYSQLELRIAADYANDRTMLDIYHNNGDIHTTTAKLMTNGREPTKEERNKAKAVSEQISRL